jgi:phage terminase small subunit
MAERAAKIELRAEAVLLELKRVAMVDLGELYEQLGHLLPVKDMPPDARRALAGIKVFDEFEGSGADRTKVGEVREVKLLDNLRALELLGKHLGLFADRLEVAARSHTGRMGSPQSASSCGPALGRGGKRPP